MTKMYSDEQLAFLREGYKLMGVDSLTAAFNREYKTNKTTTQIKSTLTNHKIVSGRNTGHATGKLLAFTLEQKYFIQELYKCMTHKEIVIALKEEYGVETTAAKIKAFTNNHKILSGRTGFFEKGSTAWNTGTKGATTANATSFKKGSTPANQQPFGHERICTKDGYILIKVDEINPNTGFRGHYRHKHVVLWEQANGPVPAGHVVTFKNGDKRDLSDENLALVKRSTLCRYNKKRVNSLPKELIPTMKNIVGLEIEIAKKAHTMREGSSK